MRRGKTGANKSSQKTMLNCIDNSGAAIVECIQIVGQKRHAQIGTTMTQLILVHRPSGLADPSQP